MSFKWIVQMWFFLPSDDVTLFSLVFGNWRDSFFFIRCNVSITWKIAPIYNGMVNTVHQKNEGSISAVYVFFSSLSLWWFKNVLLFIICFKCYQQINIAHFGRYTVHNLSYSLMHAKQSKEKKEKKTTTKK